MGHIWISTRSTRIRSTQLWKRLVSIDAGPRYRLLGFAMLTIVNPTLLSYVVGIAVEHLPMQTGVSRYVGILFCCHVFFSSLLIFIVCKYLLDHAFFLLFSLLPEYVAVKYDMHFPPLMSPYFLCLLTPFFLPGCLRDSGLLVSQCH